MEGFRVGVVKVGWGRGRERMRGVDKVSRVLNGR